MNICLKLLPVAAIFLFSACSKPTEQHSEKAKTETAAAPADAPKMNSITGVVTEIQPGKDGYTAKVRTAKQTDVYVTVSRVNLKDPASYRSVNVGDTLQATGEEWEMNEQTHLRALEIR